MIPTPLDVAQQHARATDFDDPEDFDPLDDLDDQADGEPPARTWLAIASTCAHGITVNVIDNPAPGADQNSNPAEFVAAGPDWRPLVTRAALNLHHNTGQPICADCTGGYARHGYRGDLRDDVSSCAVVVARYAELADILGIPTNIEGDQQ
ncbi:hypothetical protein [Yinghuangia sp. YIM S10712]|uniref:hypothetical protein n=1 Tax=Yinghuangia sp. YIM S10712 TaxID=3436930 RepID=UPI003F52B0B7